MRRKEQGSYRQTPPTKMFNAGHLKLRGMDVNLVRFMLTEFRSMLQKLLIANEVHLLSCPYDGSFSGPTSKAFEVKTGLMKQREGVFVFDPNTEMELFALSRFYDEDSQSKRWLEIWAELALVVQEMRKEDDENKSAFHFLCRSEPPLEKGVSQDYQWELWERDGLKGNAQHGELRMAVLAGAKSEASGLRFHQYTEGEEPSLENRDLCGERERRKEQACQRFFIKCSKTELEAKKWTETEELDFQYRADASLPKIVDDIFPLLKKLEKVSLSSCNFLTELPDSIGQIQALTGK